MPQGKGWVRKSVLARYVFWELLVSITLPATARMGRYPFDSIVKGKRGEKGWGGGRGVQNINPKLSSNAQISNLVQALHCKHI